MMRLKLHRCSQHLNSPLICSLCYPACHPAAVQAPAASWWDRVTRRRSAAVKSRPMNGYWPVSRCALQGGLIKHVSGHTCMQHATSSTAQRARPRLLPVLHGSRSCGTDVTQTQLLHRSNGQVVPLHQNTHQTPGRVFPASQWSISLPPYHLSSKCRHPCCPGPYLSTCHNASGRSCSMPYYRSQRSAATTG